MDIYVFSNNKNIGKCFASVKKGHSISYHAVSEVQKILEGGSGGFVYLDCWNQTEPAMKKLMQALQKKEGYNFGIIDAKGLYRDPALLFFSGASDYIGKDLCASGLTQKRLQEAVNFKSAEIEAFIEHEKAVSRMAALSGRDWSGVKSGSEYTFLFMFIELDNKAEIRQMGQEYATRVLDQFHDYITEVVTPVNGKVWMWMDFGGLVLFPFNGKECEAVIPAFKLMLDNRFTSSEIFNMDILLTYRIAMHIGSTVYKSRGDTGTIVSDSINSIFHLGQKFATPGTFCMSQDIFQYVPKGLGHCFMSAGDFEGREIMKMIPLK